MKIVQSTFTDFMTIEGNGSILADVTYVRIGQKSDGLDEDVISVHKNDIRKLIEAIASEAGLKVKVENE